MKLPKVTKKKFDNWINFYLNLCNRKLRVRVRGILRSRLNFILNLF